MSLAELEQLAGVPKSSGRNYALEALAGIKAAPASTKAIPKPFSSPGLAAALGGGNAPAPASLTSYVTPRPAPVASTAKVAKIPLGDLASQPVPQRIGGEPAEETLAARAMQGVARGTAGLIAGLHQMGAAEATNTAMPAPRAPIGMPIPMPAQPGKEMNDPQALNKIVNAVSSGSGWVFEQIANQMAQQQLPIPGQGVPGMAQGYSKPKPKIKTPAPILAAGRSIGEILPLIARGVPGMIVQTTMGLYMLLPNEQTGELEAAAFVKGAVKMPGETVDAAKRGDWETVARLVPQLAFLGGVGAHGLYGLGKRVVGVRPIERPATAGGPTARAEAFGPEIVEAPPVEPVTPRVLPGPGSQGVDINAIKQGVKIPREPKGKTTREPIVPAQPPAEPTPAPASAELPKAPEALAPGSTVRYRNRNALLADIKVDPDGTLVVKLEDKFGVHELRGTDAEAITSYRPLTEAPPAKPAPKARVIGKAKGEPQTRAEGEREQLIERMVEAAREPLPKIVERADMMGTDGKLHGFAGFPRGVEATGEKGPSYFVAQSSDGTTWGKRYSSREEATAALNAMRDVDAAEFRQALHESSDARLAEQSAYWLKETAEPAVVETKPKAKQVIGKAQPRKTTARKLMTAEQISDFQPGVDKVVRRGDKTYVVSGRGELADTQISSDVMTPQNVENMRKLTPAQLDGMENAIKQTPYLSPEGKQERLAAIADIRKEPSSVGKAGVAPPAGAKADYVSDEQGQPLKVYRGESSGELRQFDRGQTNEKGFFFTPDKDIASVYAKGGEPNEYYLKGKKVLDLTKDTPDADRFIRNWAKEWNDEYDWIDRMTGEARDPVEVVQSGGLYDWEGDWSGRKWKDLQATAERKGYDAVVLPDWDNQKGVFSSVVVFKPEQIVKAKDMPASTSAAEVQAPSAGGAKAEVAAAPKPTVMPAKKTLAPEVVAKFDAAEAAALERIKSRGGRLTSGVDPFDVIDYTIVGAARIAKGAIKFADWSAEMIKTFGDEIKPHLKAVWQRSRAYHASDMKPSGEGKRVIGAKNALTNARRAELGLPEVETRPGTTADAQTKAAKRAIESGKIKPEELVAELNTKPRELNLIEQRAMALHLADVESKLSAARRAGESTKALEAQYDAASKANKAAGTETARVLQSRDTEFNPDSLEEWLQKGRTSRENFGEKEVKEVVTLHEQLMQGKAKEAAHVERLRTPRVAKTPADLVKAKWGDSNTIVTASIREAARARLLERGNRLNAGFDPTVVADLAIEIGYHVEAGARFSYKVMRDYLKSEFGVTDKEISRAYAKATNDKRLKGSLEKQQQIGTQLQESIATKTPPAKAPPIEYDTAWVNQHRENTKLRLKLEAVTSPKRSVGAVVRDVLVQTANIPTGWLAAWDDSFIGRQGLKMLAHQPKVWAGGVKPSLQAMKSEPVTWTIDAGIHEHPQFGLAQRSGLEYTAIEPTAGLSLAEETAMGLRIGEKIPVIGKALRPFDRAYTTAANFMRHDAFYRMAEAKGDLWSAADYKAYASFLNKLTGRGDLGKLNTMQAGLNAIFISPRKIAADFQILTTPFSGESRAVKIEAAKTLVRYTAALTTFALVVNASGKGEVGLDPSNADFMKLRLKGSNTRFDLTGGQSTLIRAVVRSGNAVMKNTKWGKSKYGDASLSDEVSRYFSYKMAPGIQLGKELVYGKNFAGEKTTPLQSAGNTLIPWNAQSVIDAWREDGAGMGVAAGIAGFWGIGAQSYKDKPKKATRPTRATRAHR